MKLNKFFKEKKAVKSNMTKILAYMNDKYTTYNTWSPDTICKYCGNKGSEYYKKQEAYIEREINSSNENTEEIKKENFEIYRCPKCGEWDTHNE